MKDSNDVTIINNIEEDIKINETFYNNEITEDISGTILSIDIFNSYLVSLINKEYSDFKSKDYFNKYYCINTKWMNNNLELYNYRKVKTLISEYKIKSVEVLDMKIKEKKIPLNPGFNNEIKESIRSENFEPEKKTMIPKKIYENYKTEESVEYFDDFVIVNKELYDQIKQDDKTENKVDICLVDNIFIYKVNENILGIGIPEIRRETLPIFKIQFFILINEKFIDMDKDEKIIFNSDSEVKEIFLRKDLEEYLKLSRKVEFDREGNFTKTDMEFNKHKIGFIFNIDFNLEKYWKRTEEKYNKKKEILNSFNKLKQIEEERIKKEEEEKRKKNEEEENKRKKEEKEKIREKEISEDKMFEETRKKKKARESIKNEEINEISNKLHQDYNKSIYKKEKEKKEEEKEKEKEKEKKEDDEEKKEDDEEEEEDDEEEEEDDEEEEEDDEEDDDDEEKEDDEEEEEKEDIKKEKKEDIKKEEEKDEKKKDKKKEEKKKDKKKEERKKDKKKEEKKKNNHKNIFDELEKRRKKVIKRKKKLDIKKMKKIKKEFKKKHPDIDLQ